MMALPTQLPRATPEQILAAVTDLETDGPVGIGEIGVHVAQAMGIDTTGVKVYSLRRLMSWGGLRTDITRLVKAGTLMGQTKADWHRASGGVFFPDGYAGMSWAYCTPGMAERLREQTVVQVDAMRAHVARKEALVILAARHPEEYRQLVRDLLARKTFAREIPAAPDGDAR